MYRIPKDYFFRIHHIRPRFKDNVEDVLLYMAHSCASLGNLEEEEYRTKLNSLIKLYPENADKNINRRIVSMIIYTILFLMAERIRAIFFFLKALLIFPISILLFLK